LEGGGDWGLGGVADIERVERIGGGVRGLRGGGFGVGVGGIGVGLVGAEMS
jgi:hypothetical protein